MASREAPVVPGMHRRGARAMAVLAACMAGVMLATVGSAQAHAKWEYHFWAQEPPGVTANITGSGGNAQAWGQWRIADGSNGTESYNDAKLYLIGTINNGAYAAQDTQHPNGPLGAWQHYQFAETGRQQATNKWTWFYSHTGINYGQSQARAVVNLCIDVAWASDPCTGNFYAGPSSY